MPVSGLEIDRNETRAAKAIELFFFRAHCAYRPLSAPILFRNNCADLPDLWSRPHEPSLTPITAQPSAHPPIRRSGRYRRSGELAPGWTCRRMRAAGCMPPDACRRMRVRRDRGESARCHTRCREPSEPLEAFYQAHREEGYSGRGWNGACRESARLEQQYPLDHIYCK